MRVPYAPIHSTIPRVRGPSLRAHRRAPGPSPFNPARPGAAAQPRRSRRLERVHRGDPHANQRTRGALKELAISRVAVLNHAVHEWDVHAALAVKAGVATGGDADVAGCCGLRDGVRNGGEEGKGELVRLSEEECGGAACTRIR